MAGSPKAGSARSPSRSLVAKVPTVKQLSRRGEGRRGGAPCDASPHKYRITAARLLPLPALLPDARLASSSADVADEEKMSSRSWFLDARRRRFFFHFAF